MALSNNTFVPLSSALDAVTRLLLIVRWRHNPANFIISGNGTGRRWRKIDLLTNGEFVCQQHFLHVRFERCRVICCVKYPRRTFKRVKF